MTRKLYTKEEDESLKARYRQAVKDAKQELERIKNEKAKTETANQ